MVARSCPPTPGRCPFTLVTTCLAAAAGIVGAYFMAEWVQKEPDLSMVLNGCLAGLVVITAGADTVSVKSAVIIGLIAGGLVVLAVIFIDSKLRIDDPVGPSPFIWSVVSGELWQ